MPQPEREDASSAARHRRREAERRRVLCRRRAIALATAGAAAALLGAALGSRVEDGERSVDTAEEPPGCDPAIAATPARLAGRMLLVRMETQATPELLRRARRGEIGGVILFPAPETQPDALRREIGRLTRAAAAGGFPPLIVAIDQEGGPVERLPALPPDVAPAELAQAGEKAIVLARDEGEATGAALAGLGVNLDLAPVLDVPVTDASFIVARAFGERPADVAARGLAFANGLAASGVGATVKHFPGLGRAEADTDAEPSTVEATREQLEAELGPFRKATEAGVAAVMVANATYPEIDARAPASLSPVVTGELLREELGFEGVIVTDDLGAGAITAAGIGEGEAAVRAARAGADLLLFALSDGDAARRALVRAVRRKRLDLEALRASCARTGALAERLAAG